MAVATKTVPKHNTTKSKASERAPREATKSIGSPRARKQVRAITRRALAYTKGQTPTDAAPMLGVSVDDMRNMRQGNKLSMPILLKMVLAGFELGSIVNGPKLKQGPRPSAFRRRKMLRARVDARMRKLARTVPGKELAKSTGLSVTGAYGLRYGTGHITLYTLLGFVYSGHSLEEIVFGDPWISAAR